MELVSTIDSVRYLTSFNMPGDDGRFNFVQNQAIVLITITRRALLTGLLV